MRASVLTTGLATALLGAWMSSPETVDASTDAASTTWVVAPFDVVEPIGRTTPMPALVSADRAARALASALETRPGVHVVGPDGVAPRADGPAAVRALARRASADRVVTGRLAPGRLGSDFDFALRSGHSGAVMHEFAVREVQSIGLDEAMDGAAHALLADASPTPAPEAALPPVSAADPRPSPSTSSPDPDEPRLLGELRSDDPISIESDELEFLNAEAKRHLVFRRNVKVVQGDIELRTSRLEAFYPEGSNQPDRFVATGGVEVSQGDRHARCARATYLRDDQVVVCTGDATLLQNCDEVRGDRIEFDLEEERVRVVGAASILIQEACEAAES